MDEGMPPHRVLGYVLAATVLLVLITIAAYPAWAAPASSSVDDVLSRAITVYEKLFELSAKGANVSAAVEELNKGLQCIGVNTSCAASYIGLAEQAASSIAPPGASLIARKALLAAAALSVPVALWLGLPRLYILLWGFARRRWVIVEEGVTVQEYVGKGGYRSLIGLYELAESGELTLRDPSPPRDFVDYLARPAYSMWLWTGLGLAVAALIAALIDASTLRPLQLVLGLVYVFFLPGYSIVEAIYPGDELSPIEHLALSIGLSLAIIPLLGLFLNYTPWHVTKLPVLLLVLLLTTSMLLVAGYRKYSMTAT